MVFWALTGTFHKQNAIGREVSSFLFLHLHVHPEVYTLPLDSFITHSKTLGLLNNGSYRGRRSVYYPSNIILHFLFYSLRLVSRSDTVGKLSPWADLFGRRWCSKYIGCLLFVLFSLKVRRLIASCGWACYGVVHEKAWWWALLMVAWFFAGWWRRRYKQ